MAATRLDFCQPIANSPSIISIVESKQPGFHVWLIVIGWGMSLESGKSLRRVFWTFLGATSVDLWDDSWVASITRVIMERERIPLLSAYIVEVVPNGHDISVSSDEDE